MTVSINGTSGLVFNDASTQNTAPSGFGFKNRIINGAMIIDQRNAGASVTVNTSADVFSADRWHGTGVTSEGVFTLQQSTTSTSGFVNSLLATVTTVDSSIGASQRYIIRHMIEGLNVGDLGWGTANAQTVTLSFWVRSSLTGTFSGSLMNAAANRSYPFSFTISSANTFEYKTITIAGDTTGTWLTTNGVGIQLSFDMGCGADLRTSANAWAAGNFRGVTGSVQLIANSGATFYITGVQLEKGSTATSFDYRPYGTELALCQRYFTKFQNDGSGFAGIACGYQGATTESIFAVNFPTQMRAEPTATISNLIVSDVVNYTAAATLGNFAAGFISAEMRVTHSSNGAQFRPATLTISSNTNGFLALSAEL
jgi:hypothetical protein